MQEDIKDVSKSRKTRRSLFKSLRYMLLRTIEKIPLSKMITDPCTTLLFCFCLSPLMNIAKVLRIKSTAKKFTKLYIVFSLLFYLAGCMFLVCLAASTGAAYYYMQSYPTKIVSHRDLSDNWSTTFSHRIPLNVARLKNKPLDVAQKTKRKMKRRAPRFARYLSNVLLREEEEVNDMRALVKDEEVERYFDKINSGFFDYFYPESRVYKLRIVLGVKQSQGEFVDQLQVKKGDISLSLDILYSNKIKSSQKDEFKLKEFNSIVYKSKPKKAKTLSFEQLLIYNPVSITIRVFSNFFSKMQKIFIFLVSSEEEISSMGRTPGIKSLNQNPGEVVFYKSGPLHLTPSTNPLALSITSKVNSKIDVSHTASSNLP